MHSAARLLARVPRILPLLHHHVQTPNTPRHLRTRHSLCRSPPARARRDCVPLAALWHQTRSMADRRNSSASPSAAAPAVGGGARDSDAAPSPPTAAGAQKVVNTHLGIDRALCGVPVLVEPNRLAVVEMAALPRMAADDRGLVHGGFYFGMADYAAMLAVNDPHVVLGAADCRFLKPVRVGDLLVARAAVRQGGDGAVPAGKKRSVVVDVFVRGGGDGGDDEGTASSGGGGGGGGAETKVFSGTFTCFVLPRHVLSRV